MENPIQTPDDQDQIDNWFNKLVDPSCPVDDIWALPMEKQKHWRGRTARWFSQNDFTCAERAEYDFINHHDPKCNETVEYINEFSKLVAISENLTKQTEYEYYENV